MKVALKSHHKVALLGAACVLACWWQNVASLSAAATKETEVLGFMQECARQEQMLKNKLAEEALWRDAKRKPELLACLETVTALRARSLLPLLVGRIAYAPEPEFVDTRIRPLWVIYPVYGALKAIGLPSVPYLLAEIKKVSPQDRTTEVGRKRFFLLLSCIEDAYEEGVSDSLRQQKGWQQGEHGKIMGKKRLELEVAATKDEKEKANLQAALDDPTFKE